MSMTLPLLVTRAASWHRDRVALEDEAGRRLTFDQVEARSNRLANALRHLSPAQNVCVGALLPNSIEFVECDFAIAKAGKVVVPISPRLAGEEIAHILRDCAAETLIFHADSAATVHALRDRLGDLRHLVVVEGEAEGAQSYEELLSRASDRPTGVDVSPGAPGLIRYTSGTTGRPKGATLSQRGRVAQMASMLTDELDLLPDDTMLHVGPLAHASGTKVLPYYVRGARNLLHRAFDPERFLWTVEHEHATGSFLVPTMLGMLLAVPGLRAARLDALRNVTYGGAPASPDKLREALGVFGPVLVQIFGSAEASHPVTTLKKHEHLVPPGKDARLGSAGREVTRTIVRLVADDGREVSPGDVGEVWVRSEHLMMGYWENPAATAEVVRDGFVRTGDLARRDEDGFLYIVDRKRDMIISGGFNIYPAEVEAALHAHPAVLDVAVIGVPDEQWGEAVKAFVVLRPGQTAGEQELIEHCRRHIASYKKPRSVEFLDALPKGATNKILKRALAEPFWQGRERRVQ